MKQKLTALAFAAACTALLSATPAFAAAINTVLSVDNGLITIDEANGQYVVKNDISSGLWIYAFGVTNPILGGSVGISGPYSDWTYLEVPIGNNGNIPNANGYLSSIATIDGDYNVSLPAFDVSILSFMIAPGATASDVFFHSAAASDVGLLAIDVTGEPFQFSTFANSTPLPAALPLFATGLGVIGLLARRRRGRSCA